LAAGETFATVGISQLTTSRQHGKPALAAREHGDAFILDGYAPWVTGAPDADFLVIGAMLEDGRQMLAAVPQKTPGITVGQPLELMALEGSLTAEIRCENAPLDRRWVLAGPTEQVLTLGKSGTGGLETSCLALGLAQRAIDHVSTEAAARPEWESTASRLRRVADQLRIDIHALAGKGSAEEAARVRGRANTLVLRATQAALIASKGTGFLRGHPAQRWARQALFFLVWSCPRPAAEATLAHLVATVGDSCL